MVRTKNALKIRVGGLFAVFCVAMLLSMGYALTFPNSSVAEETSPAASSVEGGVIGLDDTLTYEGENCSLLVTVSGDATVASEAVDSADKGLSMSVVPLDESDSSYQAAEDFAAKDDESREVIGISALELSFSYDGCSLDVSDCSVTAEVFPSEKIQDAVKVSDEAAEAGVELTVLGTDESGEAEELGSTIVGGDDAGAESMAVTLNSSKPAMQVIARSAINPHFTVQYYANMEVARRDDDGYLTIIDTNNGGNNTGGILPTNGVTPKTTKLYLDDAGNGKRKVATTVQLTELYTANEYDYFNAPDLRYFNVMAKNTSYKLAELWVLKDGKDAKSTNRDDWTIYGNPSDLKFTNSESSAGANTVYIKDGSVIRLVADTTKALYNNAATFYDYDITDDGRTTWDGTNGSHGINSSSNYAGSGAKFAFGNANTGTALQNESWNGSTLNQYNHSGNGYLGCTFGLVTGLASDGTIQYASGVDAPKLFNDGNANGKTTHDDLSLNFNRSGDTYTLTSVKGTGLTGLEHFNNPQTPGKDPYTHIWTNNFWPMDERSSTDGLTGYYMDRGTWVGYGGNKLYPTSDDGLAHNNMFGMQYQVSFTLTEDYCGPLEYYFFGDDDMWVFLDGRLVCDIGGVHSSVGQYVNLWDYIAKGDSGTHTLSFFYTERGLSGSTCYMQFTLPSVSSVPVQHDTGKLVIQKEVVGTADSTQEFTFDIELSDTTDVYAIQRYDEDGNLYGEDGPSPIEGGKGTFTLKDGEYVEIDYLPYGTTYTITETNVSGGCTVSNTVNDGETNYSVSASGAISEGQDGSVVFTNRFMPKLPQTGGPGTLFFSLGGAALVCASAYGFYRRRSASR